MGMALQAKDLRKTYAGTVAVESLSLEVEAGKVLGFLGPNGAGKTTVIRILSTILVPDSGAFWVAGVFHTHPQQIRQRLGVLPESAGYPAGLTGEEWLTYHGRLFGRTRSAARATARRLLDDVGLSGRGTSRIGTYSRGMRQRLGIARALVNDPDVVFLDEPTLGLDPSGQIQVLEIVTRLARKHGVTVMMSTHLLAEVEQVCDEVLILNRGHAVAQGTVAEVVHRAAAPRQALVRVPPELHDRALTVLGDGRIESRPAGSGRRGELTVSGPITASPEQLSSRALRPLLESGIPVLAFTLEGGRLSDAFLAVTAGSGG